MNPKSFLLATLEVAPEDIEAVYAVLYCLNACGLEEKNRGAFVIISAAFEDAVTEDQVREALEPFLIADLALHMERVRIDDVRFKPKPFDPVELVTDFWIVPPPELSEGVEFPTGQKMVIRPGAAFGTGRHESTRLAASLIKQERRGASSLLDVGTGSGILAVYAGLTGFSQVVAVEIDDESRINAGENFELNRMTVPLYDALEKVPGQFEMVVANIITPTLVEIKQDLLSRLQKGGVLIMSGITLSEVPVIQKAFDDLKLLATVTEGEWTALAYGQREGTA